MAKSSSSSSSSSSHSSHSKEGRSHPRKLRLKKVHHHGRAFSSLHLRDHHHHHCHHHQDHPVSRNRSMSPNRISDHHHHHFASPPPPNPQFCGSDGPVMSKSLKKPKKPKKKAQKMHRLLKKSQKHHYMHMRCPFFLPPAGDVSPFMSSDYDVDQFNHQHPPGCCLHQAGHHGRYGRSHDRGPPACRPTQDTAQHKSLISSQVETDKPCPSTLPQSEPHVVDMATTGPSSTVPPSTQLM